MMIWLQTHTIFWLWRNHFSQLVSVRVVSDLRQKEIHTAQQLVPELSAFEIEMAIEKIKSHITKY